MGSSDRVLLGTGRFSDVHKLFNGEEDVAEKCFFDSQTCTELYIFETDLLKSLSEKKNLYIISMMKPGKNVSYQMEYAELGSLDQWVSEPSLKTPLRVQLMFQIAMGMEFLHSEHVIHGDLRPENVVLRRNFNAKICDFGASQKCDISIEDKYYHPVYKAPERLENMCTASDVFSFGIFLWEMISRRRAFEDIPLDEIPRFISEYNRPDVRQLGEMQQSLPVADYWDEDPTRRPGFKDIKQEMNRPWVSFNDAEVESCVKELVHGLKAQKRITYEEQAKREILSFVYHEETKPGYPSESPALHPEIRFPAGDFLIIHDVEDTESAELFRNAILSGEMMIKEKTTNPELSVIKKEDIIVNTLGDYLRFGTEIFSHFGQVYDQHDYYFVLLSDHLNGKNWDNFLKRNVHDALANSLNDSSKQWSIIPVHTKSKPTRKYKTPFSFGSIKPVEDITLSNKYECLHILRLLPPKIEGRKSREDELKLARRSKRREHLQEQQVRRRPDRTPVEPQAPVSNQGVSTTATSINMVNNYFMNGPDIQEGVRNMQISENPTSGHPT